ncbi:hypothetical protein [Hymenobacter guriensis]|uniref:Uncharacterized protein n=1 Tax=Hymenobacter guriensis TaxID=2793065 RepID=A0ABS0KWV1_9BACT|nr:hypothetical protein [Hymenobacter guriensis]MBG8552320.1 hypothetical protein [Hymenobacter guriensis]
MHQNHYNTQPDAPVMWLALPACDEAPCPKEIEEVKARFSWRALLTAPWHCVETLLWGVAAQDEKYLQEVPVVLQEVKDARTLKAV